MRSSWSDDQPGTASIGQPFPGPLEEYGNFAPKPIKKKIWANPHTSHAERLRGRHVVAIVLGLVRGQIYAAECRLAGCSLREHECRRVGIEHAPSPARP